MSELFTYQVHGQLATLRVDSVNLGSFARDLHSCARRSVKDVPTDTPADIVWREDTPDEFSLQLFNDQWGSGFTAENLFFQSENLITNIFSERHQEKLQLHAAGVVSPSGEGWLIAGDSAAGKTSFTLALVLEGWRWISDEMILVEEHDYVRALGVARNFNIKQVSFPNFPETTGLPHGIELYSTRRDCRVRFVDPEILAPGQGAGSASINNFLFPRYDSAAHGLNLNSVAGIALFQRLHVSLFRTQSWALPWIQHVVANVPAWDLAYSHPRVAAREIHRRFGRR